MPLVFHKLHTDNETVMEYHHHSLTILNQIYLGLSLQYLGRASIPIELDAGASHDDECEGGEIYLTSKTDANMIRPRHTIFDTRCSSLPGR